MSQKNFLQAFAGAGALLALLVVTAPMMREQGSNRDIEAFIVRWQTATYNPATRPEAKNHYLTTATDTTGYVRGLRRDTSAVFEIFPYLSFDVVLTDTVAASDSAAQTMLLYAANDNQFRKNIPVWSEFTLIDSIQVVGESTTHWIVTDGAIPVKKYGFVVARGNAANKKTARVRCKLTLGGRQMR